MSRTKNRGFQQSFSPSYTIRRWRLGEYIRLSKEDLKKGKDDSNSVKNQRDLLNDFYQKHIEEFESVSEYVDDGHTGTDANRENFQRLLADVMSQPRRFPTAPGRCNERENQLCCGKRPFPFCPELQRCGKSD